VGVGLFNRITGIHLTGTVINAGIFDDKALGNDAAVYDSALLYLNPASLDIALKNAKNYDLQRLNLTFTTRWSIMAKKSIPRNL